MHKALIFILFLLVGYGVGVAQVKTLQTGRTTEIPRIDGVINDAVWQQVPAATDFITNSPSYGAAAHQPTWVKVLYDDAAIYIGARMADDPQKIRKQFTVRDESRSSDVDYFSVFIDTYNDRQNAYQFLVTARNVQSDARVSPNASTGYGIYGDLSWDAVWESQVAFDSAGWSVEMRIPLFSIRFSSLPVQEWGLQFLRFTRRFNETSFWNPVDPNVSGLVNQFGMLSGLTNIRPPLRLSFSPYVSTGIRSQPILNEPYKQDWLKSGGMDVKYGISESFTLDATLIPDFGQVISDNVVNNISPFEIQFRENRQFFTEGTELFNKAGIFYSRRIGRTPENFQRINNEVKNGSLQDYDILKNPEITRIYNALKFSGRTRKNLGIGVFNAVGQPTHATLRNVNNGRDTIIQTEALTNYNVFVLDQALKNRSYITFTNTNVLRNGSARDANVTGIDLALYDKKNLYGLILKPRYSKIFDPNKSYDGFHNYTEFGKVSGKVQFSISNDIISHNYDPNDLGFQLSPNQITNRGEFSYNIYQPTKNFINQQYGFNITQSYLYRPTLYQQTEVNAYAFWIFNNFWDLRINAGSLPFWFNDFFELQTPSSIFDTPRKRLKRAPQYYLYFEGSSDSRKRLFASWSFEVAEGPLADDPYNKTQVGLRYRFSDRFSLEADFSRRHDNGQFGYAFRRDAVTGEPLLARRQYTDVTTLVNGIYNFTSRMNLTFRARHYWNRLINTDLYDVLPDGHWTPRFDLDPSDQDENYNAFNLDVFYTWDFRLGSRIILGWKNWLGLDYESFINGNQYNTYLSNTRRMLASPHGNEITLRFIYFLDYNQLSRKFNNQRSVRY